MAITIRMAALSMLCGVLFAGSARAQTLEPPRHRQGYYIAVGLQNGADHTWEDGDALGLWPGGGFSLRLGQLITRRLGLGLAIEGGSSQGDGQTAGRFGLLLEGHVVLTGNLAVQGGVGLGVVTLDDPKDPDEGLRGAAGAVYALGVGYDFFPWQRDKSGGLSVRPGLQVRYLPSTEVHNVAVLVSLELGWWSGLPRNQLDLPPGEAFKSE